VLDDECRGRRKWDGAGEGLVMAGSAGDVVGLHGTLAGKTRCQRDQKREERRNKQTSEELDEVRSGGTSLEAGETLASLGLSLVNSFRMGEERGGKQEKG